MDKAVILARGLGTRMRKQDADAAMSSEQAAIAETGVKALIPMGDRPFLDYVLSTLADAGYKQICMVVGPEHGQVREYYGNTVDARRLSFSFAVQEKPLGTADAVAAAEAFAGDDPILVINSDNHYPLEALTSLSELSTPGLAAFVRESLIANSNIPADRITKFSVVKSDADGFMTEIIEKPGEDVIAALPEPICVSMNCWRFGPSIFEGCRNIQPSARGELELPDAVQYTIEKLGEKYAAVPVHAGVLDMSSRADIADVAVKLTAMNVQL